MLEHVLQHIGVGLPFGNRDRLLPAVVLVEHLQTLCGDGVHGAQQTSTVKMAGLSWLMTSGRVQLVLLARIGAAASRLIVLMRVSVHSLKMLLYVFIFAY